MIKYEPGDAEGRPDEILRGERPLDKKRNAPKTKTHHRADRIAGVWKEKSNATDLQRNTK
jgi:hypothetical protein